MSSDSVKYSDLLDKLKATLLYFGATILGFFISIVTYPLFAKYLNIEEFAAANYFTNYSGFFGFFFSLNLYIYYSSIFYKLDFDAAQNTLKSFMVFLLAWNVLALAVVYFVSVLILDHILKIKFHIAPYLFSSLAAVSAVSIRSLFLIELRLRKKAFQFFVISVSGKVGVVFLSLLFVMYYQQTAESRLLGALVAEILCTLAIYLYIFKDGGFEWPKLNLKQILLFIWPLLVASIVYYPAAGLDQVILERYVNKTELGLYSIALGFAGYLHTFNFSVYQTIEPDIIRAKAQGDKHTFKKNFILLLAVAASSTLCFCLTSKYLISFMSHDKFTEAYTTANILSISFFFVLLFSVGNTLLTTAGRSKTVLLINFIGLLAIIGFSFLFKGHDSIGIAVARVLTYVILAVTSFMFSRRLGKVSWAN